MNANDVARGAQSRGAAPIASAGCAARIGPSPTATDTSAATAGRALVHQGAVDRSWVRDVGGATAVFFDLASLTKPMAAVAAVRAGLDRNTPLGALVPEARGTPTERASLELLLAHRAGLAGHRALYEPLLRGAGVDVKAALREAAESRRPECVGEPAFEPVYSDLGYVLAGEMIARATGARDAGEAIARLVLEPLGLEGQAGTIRELAARGVLGPFAPTEDVAWRGGVVTAAVHDENAWALTGLGGSGHAGIFGTVDAVLTFGVAVLDGLEGWGVFGSDGGPGSARGSARSLEWLVAPRPGGTLRAGFDGKSDEGSSAGVRLGSRSFGHLGFTGTSVWLDPDAAVVVALLTNRVCPSRDHRAIRDERPRAHDSLFDRAVLLRERG